MATTGCQSKRTLQYWAVKGNTALPRGASSPMTVRCPDWPREEKPRRDQRQPNGDRVASQSHRAAPWLSSLPSAGRPWYVAHHGRETTDDAQVDADVVAVPARLLGHGHEGPLRRQPAGQGRRPPRRARRRVRRRQSSRRPRHRWPRRRQRRGADADVAGGRGERRRQQVRRRGRASRRVRGRDVVLRPDRRGRGAGRVRGGQPRAGQDGFRPLERALRDAVDRQGGARSGARPRATSRSRTSPARRRASRRSMNRPTRRRAGSSRPRRA